MDWKLIEAVLQKKQNAFTIFYNDIVDHFFSYLKSNFSLSDDEIYDIISNTFVKIWNKLDTFDKDKWDFIPWCWTILRNTTKDYFKKKKDYAFSELELENSDWEKTSFEDNIQDETDVFEILEQDYKLEQIKQAMSQLKADEREIIYLRYSEEKSLEEIAKIMWLSYSNVRVKLHRSLQKLKKLLKTCNNT
jgi:RNA polymerase sigma factor (sigma-70 family)